MFLIILVFEHNTFGRIGLEQLLNLLLLLFYGPLFFLLRFLKCTWRHHLPPSELRPVYLGEKGVLLDLAKARALLWVLVQDLSEELLGLTGQILR